MAELPKHAGSAIYALTQEMSFLKILVVGRRKAEVIEWVQRCILKRLQSKCALQLHDILYPVQVLRKSINHE